MVVTFKDKREINVHIKSLRLIDLNYVFSGNLKVCVRIQYVNTVAVDKNQCINRL